LARISYYAQPGLQQKSILWPPDLGRLPPGRQLSEAPGDSLAAEGNTMTPIQETMLRQRLANGTPDERLLNDKLVAIGGDILVLMPPDMKPNPEFQQQWVRWQLEHGQLIDAPITLRRKEVSECHRNVATIWRKKQYGIAAICSGYGLLDDGLWADHSWGILPDGGILETTFRREKYFGLMHEAGMADIFADIELGKLAGRKGAA
jgi:hypothetical protein